MSQPDERRPRVTLIVRSLRDELAFLLDSTVDLPAESYDRDTLLMRLETAFDVRLAAERLKVEAAEMFANNCADRTADANREALAAEREVGRLRTALESAQIAMSMAASALRNGGGTGHEVVRLEESVSSVRAALAGSDSK